MKTLKGDERDAAISGLEYIVSRLNNIEGDHLRELRKKRLDASKRALEKLRHA